MTVYSPHQSFVTTLAFFAISASKRDRQLLNEVFIYLQDITPSPGYMKGWSIFKMTAVTLGLNIFKSLYLRLLRIVNTVVTSVPSKSDQLTKFFFLQTKATHF